VVGGIRSLGMMRPRTGDYWQVILEVGLDTLAAQILPSDRSPVL
jgi:hypothetical protein